MKTKKLNSIDAFTTIFYNGVRIHIKIFFILLMLQTSFVSYAQLPSNSGSDTIYDMYGTKYHYSELKVGGQGVDPLGRPAALPSITCGYFELYFETGSGMEGTSALELARRNVLCQVFTDLSGWINSPLTSNPDPATNKAKIFVRNLSSMVTSTVGIAGFGGAYMSPLPNGASFNSAYTWDNALWQTINTGYSAYYHNAYPLNNNDLYHGFMAFNFSTSLPFTYNYNLAANPTASEMDFYTLALHEATHALGFLTFITATGTGFNGTNYYSRYDNFLMSGLNGLPLIKQLPGCGPKFIQYNPSTPAYNTLSPGQPCPNSQNQLNTNCATAVKYFSTRNNSPNVPVFTSPCFTASSLSHFEDQCSPWMNNDAYFVMSNVVPTGIAKRFLKPEERNVICDLGYNTGSVFGSAANLNFKNYGSTCGDRVAGINDGVANSGQYTIVTNVGVSTSVISPLVNDVNAVTVSCLQQVFGAGSINISGNNFTYVPSIPGIHMLQYIPISPTGKKGNMTYVYIFVRDNCPVNCSVSSNGGFENSTGCGNWYDNGLAVPGFGAAPHLFNISCWTPNNGTPDFYARNCNSPYWGGGFNVPVPYSPAVNTHDFPNPNNNKFLGIVATEGIQNQLATPLVPGNQYQVSFKAYRTGTVSNAEITIAACSRPSGVVGLINAASLPSFYNLIGSYIFSAPNAWQSYNLVFTYNGSQPAGYVSLFNGGNGGVFIDDFNIVQLGTPNSAAAFNLPANMCSNQSISNLLSVLSPTTALAQGGSFTGPGIQNNAGVWSLDLSLVSPGIQNYSFVYTNSSTGCTYTTNAQVNIYPPASVNISPSSAFLCTNLNQTSVNLAAFPSVSPGPGITYTWTPGSSLLGQNISVSPSSTTIYTVAVDLGCIVTNTVSVSVSNNCCPQTTSAGMNVAPVTLASGSTLNGPVVINQNLTLNGAPGSVLFQNSEFLIAPGVQIIVQPGIQLVLDKVHLYACSNTMWDGIVIQDGANLISNAGAGNATLIEDAITAIDVDNNTMTAFGTLFEINGLIFNKNYVGLRIRNSNVTNMPVLLRSCVFTSRSLNFTATTWPNSSTNSPDLRYAAATSTAGVTAPYGLQNAAFSNLKSPYNNQPAHIGIQIMKINNVNGSATSPGVNIGNDNQQSWTQFNLFDGLGTGIEVTDASLTTMNNVFQNMKYYNTPNGMQGGTAIKHIVNGQMNARLALSPVGLSNSNTNMGNRFWECYYGVQANNVYEFDIEYGIFRSKQNTGGFGFLPGNTGIYLASNRYSYRMRHNDINNINDGIQIQFNQSVYDMNGSGPVVGIYADSLVINHNYFGPEVNSSNAMGSNYLNNAVTINESSGSNILIANFGTIQSNKVNRAYRGIYVNGMDGYPVDISGNLIELADDNMYGNSQYGISLNKTQGGIVVNTNTLLASGPSNPLTTLVFCQDNNFPIITCNDLSSSYQAFEFSQNNNGTKWFGNLMQNHQMGLVLSNGGVIGQQGSPGFPSDNQWLGTWGGSFYETYVTPPSDAFFSPLIVQKNPPYEPLNNGFVPASITYAAPGNIQLTTGNYFCQPSVLTPPPNYKITGANGKNTDEGWDVAVFPNPTQGNVTILSSSEKENLSIKIFEVTGKMIYEKDIVTSENKYKLDLSLDRGIYMLEIKNAVNKVSNKKLIIN